MFTIEPTAKQAPNCCFSNRSREEILASDVTINEDTTYLYMAKHIFRAWRTYAEDYEPVIIFANNIEKAKEKAEAYFNSIFVTVRELRKTSTEQVFEV